MATETLRVAKRYIVRGRVQGVGFRYFVQREGQDLRMSGYAKNLDDGSVEVYAIGTVQQQDELAARLHAGPRFSDVRGVEVDEAPMLKYDGFRILS